MYRIVLRVERVPSSIGLQAAVDIANGFKNRPWQEQIVCVYERGGISFTSENDFDENGLATQDEFAHEFSANVSIYNEDDGNLSIVRVDEF